MIVAVPLAFAAAGLAVFGAWEAVAAIERMRPVAALAAALEPITRARREGRAATSAERVRLALVAAAALAAAGWLVGGVPLALLCAVAGPAIAVAVLRARHRAYSRELARGAAGAARALADALAAGHSIRGAIAVAADGATGAAGVELRRAASGIALGAPTEAVLEALRRSAAGRPWDAMVAGILLQRDAGGDLCGLLRDLAESLDAAGRAERDARAATAQARASARIVLALPAGAAILMELLSPSFASTLLSHPASAWLVAAAAVLQLAGLVVIRAIARAR